jgi:peroxiredoxin
MLLTCTALALCAAGIHTIPQFTLRDTQGAVHTPADWSGRKAVVLFFVTNDCPVANGYVPEMDRLHESFRSRGVAFYAVQADTSVPQAVAAQYARDFHYAFPLLLDPHQILVHFTGASVISQAVVLSPEGQVVYRGRVDNRVEDFGKQRPEATVHDLRDALDAILAGKPVMNPVTRSIGCAISTTTERPL